MLSADEHCACCVTRLGFGARRKRVLLLAVLHPEFDVEEWRGVILIETEGGGRARGQVIAQAPMIEPELRSA